MILDAFERYARPRDIAITQFARVKVCVESDAEPTCAYVVAETAT